MSMTYLSLRAMPLHFPIVLAECWCFISAHTWTDLCMFPRVCELRCSRWKVYYNWAVVFVSTLFIYFFLSDQLCLIYYRCPQVAQVNSRRGISIHSHHLSCTRVSGVNRLVEAHSSVGRWHLLLPLTIRSSAFSYSTWSGVWPSNTTLRIRCLYWICLSTQSSIISQCFTS